MEILKKHNIRPNKLMGQNFLISEHTLKKIVEAAKIQKDDIVLEVGPGLGFMTLELAQRAKKVIAVEKDKKFCAFLKNLIKEQGIKNINIIDGDILEVQPPREVEPLTKYKIVANLPYFLTSRFLRKFLAEEKNRPEEMTLLVQKELAERITAQPPQMNMLALSVQAYGHPKIIEKIPAGDFWPKPKVDSAIIKISDVSDIFFTQNSVNEKLFFSLAKTAFSQKRKTLANSLSKFFGSKQKAESQIKKAGLNPHQRPQELSLEEWKKIAAT